MCNSILCEDHFSIIYVPDQYKIKKISNKAVDDLLVALEFVPNWFVTSKMIKKLFTDLCTDESILYFNELGFVSLIRIKKRVIKLSILILL